MFDRWQTLIASFDYINETSIYIIASFVFINETCNYKNKAFNFINVTCVYRLSLVKHNFPVREEQVYY